MSIAIENIDRLKEAGFKENQAKALVVLFKEKGQAIDLASINNKILSLKNEMIMWIVGLLIVNSGFLFAVLNQRINSFEGSLNQRIDSFEGSLNQRITSSETSLNQRVASSETSLNQRIASSETSLNQRITNIKDSLEKDIAENRVLIQENKVLIQKILDNQNKVNTRSD